MAAAHALLDLPGEAREPVLVVLDEFQALRAACGDGEGVLRSHTRSPQKAGRVTWAFTGSQPNLLAAAFADAGRAYYQQALPVPLRRLADADLSRGTAQRFTATRKEAAPHSARCSTSLPASETRCCAPTLSRTTPAQVGWPTTAAGAGPPPRCVPASPTRRPGSGSRCHQRSRLRCARSSGSAPARLLAPRWAG